MPDLTKATDGPRWDYTYPSPFKSEEYRDAARQLGDFKTALKIAKALRSCGLPLPTDDMKAAQAVRWLLYEVAPNV